MKNDDFWRRLHEPCPLLPGTRIRLIAMPDDPCPIPTGSMGTVTGGTGAQIDVDWDDGRNLHLLPGVDRWEVITWHGRTPS